jgi:hypothetical protein
LHFHRLTPKDFAVAGRIQRRFGSPVLLTALVPSASSIDEIDAGGREVIELFDIVAALNDVCIDEGGRPDHGRGG